MTTLELTHYVPVWQGGELLCENRLRVTLDRSLGSWCVREATLFSSAGRPVATLGPVELIRSFGVEALQSIVRKAGYLGGSR